MNIIIAVGLNHNTATVEIRERLAFDKDKLANGLGGLKDREDIIECAILSTCNRVEIYLSVKNTLYTQRDIEDYLSSFHQINKSEFVKSLYFLTNLEAVRHIFRVTASLDSMVVGEPQILGQIKDAFEFALNKKTTGIILNKVFKKAISVAKLIRTETKIAENAVSISFAAVELAKKIFTEISNKTFMLLGAGDMAELAARHLVGNKLKNVLVANRTFQRGCEIAEEFGGRAIKFETFLKELIFTDIVICSTGASSYILYKDEMQKIMKERKQKPIFIIDISVPRNIDPDINKLDNVYLYNIDDLQNIVDINIFERKKEAQKAENIIDEEVQKFGQWLQSLDSIPIVIALRQKAEDIKKKEIENFKNKFPNVNSKELEAIEYLADSITTKLIHNPTIAIKEECEDRETLIFALKKLYAIKINN